MMFFAWFIAGFLCGNWSVWTLMMTSAALVIITASSALMLGNMDIWSALGIVAALVVHQVGYLISILFRATMPALHERLSYRF